jgi:hypothetical protein
MLPALRLSCSDTPARLPPSSTAAWREMAICSAPGALWAIDQQRQSCVSVQGGADGDERVAGRKGNAFGCRH